MPMGTHIFQRNNYIQRGEEIYFHANGHRYKNIPLISKGEDTSRYRAKTGSFPHKWRFSPTVFFPHKGFDAPTLLCTQYIFLLQKMRNSSKGSVGRQSVCLIPAHVGHMILPHNYCTIRNMKKEYSLVSIHHPRFLVVALLGHISFPDNLYK